MTHLGVSEYRYIKGRIDILEGKNFVLTGLQFNQSQAIISSFDVSYFSMH